MDVNPSTINKLIGAKVTSYKDLEGQPEIKKTKEDLVYKQDIHINDNPYDIHQKSPEYMSKARGKRLEDAYSFLIPELDDIYDDLYEEEEDQDAGIDPKYIDGINRGIQGMGNIPRKKRYQTDRWHARNKRKYWDRARQRILPNVAAAAAQLSGKQLPLTPDQIKEGVSFGDRLAAPFVRRQAYKVKNYIKKISGK